MMRRQPGRLGGASSTVMAASSASCTRRAYTGVWLAESLTEATSRLVFSLSASRSASCSIHRPAAVKSAMVVVGFTMRVSCEESRRTPVC